MYNDYSSNKALIGKSIISTGFRLVQNAPEIWLVLSINWFRLISITIILVIRHYTSNNYTEENLTGISITDNQAMRK